MKAKSIPKRISAALLCLALLTSLLPVGRWQRMILWDKVSQTKLPASAPCPVRRRP